MTAIRSDPEKVFQGQDALEPAQNHTRGFFLTTAYVVLNTFCTVILVFVNKALFNDSPFVTLQFTTAAWHFLATTLLLFTATIGPSAMFTMVKLPFLDVLPVAILLVGFLILGNLSLAMNPVPFYQIARIMTTPMVVLLNYLLFRKTLSRQMLLAVALCCGGVVSTVSGVAISDFNGTVIAVLAFTASALYQIFIGMKLSKLKVSPPQLLLNQAPLSMAILIVLAPWYDTFPEASAFSQRSICLFLFSGLLAAGLNLSQFLIIGRTSALTFNIVSNAKNIMIISYGWYQEGRAISITDVGGVSLAIAGAAAYSLLALKAPEHK